MGLQMVGGTIYAFTGDTGYGCGVGVLTIYYVHETTTKRLVN